LLFTPPDNTLTQVKPHCSKSPMTIDNHKRAVLTIAALTQLVETKRRLAPDDAAGRETMLYLERLVINGTVTARDEILKCFAKDETFTRVLMEKRALELT